MKLPEDKRPTFWTGIRERCEGTPEQKFELLFRIGRATREYQAEDENPVYKSPSLISSFVFSKTEEGSDFWWDKTGVDKICLK